MKNWPKLTSDNLIEFIIPLENIEVIQNINKNKNNLLNLDLRNLFLEYTNKNLAIILIENPDQKNNKIYLRTRILGKKIDKNLNIENDNLQEKEYYSKIIKK